MTGPYSNSALLALALPLCQRCPTIPRCLTHWTAGVPFARIACRLLAMYPSEFPYLVA